MDKLGAIGEGKGWGCPSNSDNFKIKMDSIDLKAHAKVNIGLQIRNQREDGYHNIHTVFQELDITR